MNKKIDKIYLSIEKQDTYYPNLQNENTDVIVRFEDGEEYVASFFSYRNVKTLRSKAIRSGHNLSGKYFWAQNMFLIDDCSRDNIHRVVEHLIDEGEFRGVFKKV